jgi:hypothetical protein
VEDLLGNIAEITATIGFGDGQGSRTAPGHIVRGSSWADDDALGFRWEVSLTDSFPSIGAQPGLK